jgi:TetR/AcrR family transcriptional regulator, regulator of cefoperazone and chloramphenicol sensitivity
MSALAQSALHKGETPQRIITAAAEIFSIHGFRGARVRDIVRLAGVNLASVNYYFGGKESLYAATIAELSSARSTKRAGEDVGLDPIESLEVHITAMLGRATLGGCGARLSRILAHESMEPTAHFDSAVRCAMEPEFERLERIIQRIDPDISNVDASALALSIMGQCYFFLFAGAAIGKLLKDRPAATTHMLAAKLTDFAVNAIRGNGLTMRRQRA